MLFETQSSQDLNQNMFNDISLHNELHNVMQPDLQKSIFSDFGDCMTNQPIEKDEHDDSKSEIAQETRQNTSFRKLPQQFIQSPVRIQSGKNNESHEKEVANQNPKKTKKITKVKQGIQKDYKKNICGYITRRVLKQALGDEYKQNIEQLCKDLNVPTEHFSKIYRVQNLQNITGPTHFYNLVNPKFVSKDMDEIIKEISTRMIFVLFFRWFVRNRYIRYLMSDGKMSQKDKYVHYKNRELLFLIASDWKDVLEKAKDNLKQGFVEVETVMDQFSSIYNQMVDGNRVSMDEQKEQKISSEPQRKTQQKTQNVIEPIQIEQQHESKDQNTYKSIQIELEMIEL